MNCLFCGASLEGMRRDAKFCKPQHRTKWNRRKKGVKPQWRQQNSVRTDTLEDLIAKCESEQFNITAGEALRQLAKKIGTPLREERIARETEEWRKAMDISKPYEG